MRVEIGPYTFKVKFVKRPEKRHGKKRIKGLKLYGSTHPATQRIFISSRSNKRVQQDTLIHELLHAVWFASGLHAVHEPDEEQCISMLAPLMLQALRSNEELREFLIDD